ncbi:MAG: helix-turn-helix domain-containing protein [Victivallaceae bacterium]|nr:helix-turn-helix domain-containing protein [Victivallaceae bacterium]
MKYFTDIELCNSGIYKNYKGHLKNISPQNYSVELIASGKMYFQQLPNETHIFDSPILRWQSPDNIYNYGSVGDSGWEHYFVTFNGERGKMIFEDGFSRLAENCFIPVKRVDLFRNLFTTIFNIQMHAGLNNNRGAFHLEEILICAIEEIAEPLSCGKYIQKFDQFCNKIISNLQKKIDLEFEARAMGLSYSHFRKLFSEYTGVSPHQYILRTRIDAAAEHIRHTSDPLKQIAAEFNLGNTAQFSKAFRKVHKIPPATYRNLHKIPIDC